MEALYTDDQILASKCLTTPKENIQGIFFFLRQERIEKYIPKILDGKGLEVGRLKTKKIYLNLRILTINSKSDSILEKLVTLN